MTPCNADEQPVALKLAGRDAASESVRPHGDTAETRSTLAARRYILIIAVIGLALIGKGFSDCRMRDWTEDTPQRLTAAEAIANGPGRNVHVEISDFMLSHEYVIVTIDDDDTMWIPVTTAEQAAQYVKNEMARIGTDDVNEIQFDYRPLYFSIIVRIPDGNEEDLEDVYNRELLHGFLITSTQSIGAPASKQLKKAYPSLNMKNLWVLELDRTPSGYIKIVMYFLCGLAIIGVAAYLGLRHGEKTGLDQ